MMMKVGKDLQCQSTKRDCEQVVQSNVISVMAAPITGHDS